ncbi:hypothetical protein BJV74DRAFT_856200 [Russula compacta]|nr:hypothetical protein BJV74DRAFT_856200 [Russula compacta]
MGVDKVDNPHCPACRGVTEMIEHLLLQCALLGQYRGAISETTKRQRLTSSYIPHTPPSAGTPASSMHKTQGSVCAQTVGHQEWKVDATEWMKGAKPTRATQNAQPTSRIPTTLKRAVQQLTCSASNYSSSHHRHSPPHTSGTT